MTLQHIDLSNLTISPLNVRKHGAKDCDDLITSIRALGILQPLLVRAVPDSSSFEVIAGQRRLNALRLLAEDGAVEPIPCLVMTQTDDAATIEASLAENIARLPMDEVDQFKAFAKLVKQGRSAEDIAQSFGITERMVSQRLALGRLHAPILTAYRKGDIHARDIRSLTMATPAQQKAWWALVKDDKAYAPTGQRLKDWLFGGAHIPTRNALFDVEATGLAIVSDLFGDEAYFADCGAFWQAQNAAIAEQAEAYRAKGWADVIVMDVGVYFASWEHRKCAKADNGAVFITASHQGEVTTYEGYITHAEAKRREKAKAGTEAQPKPELTKAAQNYVDLHRHAALRADLLAQSGLALRLIAAHMICGSPLWQVTAEPQTAAKPEIADSLAANKGQQAMNAERAVIFEMLDICEDAYWFRPNINDIFAKLHAMDDETITRILTFFMAETLSLHSPLLDTLGQTMSTDVSAHWSQDHTFFDLIRDKQVLNAMIADWAGPEAAAQNVTTTAKVQRSILMDCMTGARKPTKSNWMPAYMAFPMGSYRADQSRAPAQAIAAE